LGRKNAGAEEENRNSCWFEAVKGDFRRIELTPSPLLGQTRPPFLNQTPSGG
jgi:hypothetical protein